MMGVDFVMLSLPPLIIGGLAAISCALLGNFLILRKQALIGDAISHVVLPGIVVGFLLSGSTNSAGMVLGAAGAALLSVLMIEGIRRAGKIEPGAAMGIVFTAMFAFGVLLLEMSDTSGVHLDVEHALYGNLESLIWLDAEGWASLLDPAALRGLPVEIWRLAATCGLVIILIVLFWRPLVIATFDDGFAQSIGIATRSLNIALVLLSALAAVMAFSAVGSILVIAMFICPPAAARLMTARLSSQILLSVVFAVLSSSLGYVFAGYGPGWFGVNHGVSAAGMIASVSGLILAMATIYYSVLTKR